MTRPCAGCDQGTCACMCAGCRKRRLAKCNDLAKRLVSDPAAMRAFNAPLSPETRAKIAPPGSWGAAFEDAGRTMPVRSIGLGIDRRPGALTDVTLARCVYVRLTEAGYRAPNAGHESVRTVGPTPEALDALERATAGAKLVRRTGPTSYVVVG